jgi:hypothetical protein
MIRLALGLLLIVIVAGCKALQAEDTAGTLQAQNAAYGTEAVQLQAAGTSERVNAQQTHVFNTTQVAGLNAVNQQLIATLIVRITPTPDLIVENAPDDMGLTVNGAGSGGVPASSTGNSNNPYSLTGVAASVRADDGCVQNPQRSFSLDTQEIYATFVANNLVSGTNLRAEWYREDELVDTADWTPNRDYEQICVWFYITQSDVPFTPGNWSVRLYANDTQIGGTQSFTFEDAMMDG